ncbi:glycosyltransferase [Tianweitania populi]|uniref:Glycosyltransferase 2-like domain-containing protein n=1 Tax=Tianweitania populi TaxID=1607949 RepID=A0A8J3GLG5_9HYPH|nr:glycosyltransferase [Tianweitania populi]GHD21440.1 hypothetical protein GCM10016234_35090 [Tianweitania populi]
MTIIANQVDVVVRFHDVSRLAELERCLFSLVGQDYRPLHIILVVQRFSDADIERTYSSLLPLFGLDQAPSFEILNWEHEAPLDARSALINLGISAAKGRFLAFLDFDQALYPEAYRLLVSQLQSAGADIAFAKVRRVEMEAFSSFLHSRAMLPSAECASLRDLFTGNVCPLHSFMVDRTRIPEQLLFFEPYLMVEEAYDFLLRICAQFRSDFTLARAGIGEYHDRIDSANAQDNVSVRHEGRILYKHEAAFVEQRRRNTPLSEPVRRALGIVPLQINLSIRDYLDGAS